MTSSKICPLHVTLTLTLSVQGHTVSYVYHCIYVCSQWIFFNHVAPLQSSHTVFSGVLLEHSWIDSQFIDVYSISQSAFD